MWSEIAHLFPLNLLLMHLIERSLCIIHIYTHTSSMSLNIGYKCKFHASSLQNFLIISLYVSLQSLCPISIRLFIYDTTYVIRSFPPNRLRHSLKTSRLSGSTHNVGRWATQKYREEKHNRVGCRIDNQSLILGRNSGSDVKHSP